MYIYIWKISSFVPIMPDKKSTIRTAAHVRVYFTAMLGRLRLKKMKRVCEREGVKKLYQGVE